MQMMVESHQSFRFRRTRERAAVKRRWRKVAPVNLRKETRIDLPPTMPGLQDQPVLILQPVFQHHPCTYHGPHD